VPKAVAPSLALVGRTARGVRSAHASQSGESGNLIQLLLDVLVEMDTERLGAQRDEDNAGAKVDRPEKESRHLAPTRQTVRWFGSRLELLAGARIVCLVRRQQGVRMFERLLEPGCTESPACQCGEPMDIASIEVLPEGSDAAVRVYRCSGCDREMRLTVWATLPAPPEESPLREL
jgi:hypothetical protein